MNNRLLLPIIVMLMIIASCENSDEPIVPIEIEKSYKLYSSGDRQYNGAGKYLADSLAVTVTDSLSNKVIPGMRVNFKIISGGGSIDTETSITNENGIAFTKWKLGNLSHDQILRVEILDETNQIIKELDFSGYAFRQGKWDKVAVEPHRYIDDLVSDTINNVTLATTTSSLWKQGDNYYDWIKVMSPEVLPYSIEINSEGTLFIGGYYGGLEKSHDHGETWIVCTDPYGKPPKNDERFIMRITSDDHIWLSKFGGSLYHSKDEGLTWTNDTIGINNNSFLDDIFRLQSGTLILMKNGKLYKSTNDGKKWSLIEIPYYPRKIFVTKNSAIILMQNEDNNVVLHKSSDEGKTFKKVLRKLTPTFVTFPKQIFHEYNGSYYVLIPEYGILKTTDFETFEEFYYNSKSNYFFIDHSKTFMVFQKDLLNAYYKSAN